jgi:hypothetical protein
LTVQKADDEAVLSHLRQLRWYGAKYEASQNEKALVLIKKISPAAWRHIHLNGH